MKTKRFSNIFGKSTLHRGTIFCCILAVVGCSKDLEGDMTYQDKGTGAQITQYTPISGGSSTEISLYGSNFEIDIQKIQVSINDKPADVLSSNGRIITARVPQNAGSGKVKLTIDGQEYIYNHDFNYGYQNVVYTYLGSTKDDVDGDFQHARLSGPRYLKWSHDSALYFIEEGESSADNFAALRVAANNQVSTLLNASQSTLVERLRAFDFSKDQNNLYLTNDNNDGGTMGLGQMSKSGSSFNNLTALSGDGGLTAVATNPVNGEVFVGTYSGGMISRVSADGSLENLFRLNTKNVNIMDILFSPDGKFMYISGAYNAHSIYKVPYDMASRTFGAVEVLAGPDANSTGNVVGNGGAARFNTPAQMDIGPEGNLYVADRKNHCIRKITPDGTVTTYAGIAGTKGMQNGNALAATFTEPEGCQFGPDGALYVADTWNHVIRKIVTE